MKISGGMHVPLLTYFSSECLSDLELDNRVGKEGGREEAREKEKGRKTLSEREKENEGESERHNTVGERCGCTTAQWPKNPKNMSPMALSYLFYIAAKNFSCPQCSAVRFCPSMLCQIDISTV